MNSNHKADAAWDDYVSQQQEEKIEELERELNAANSNIIELQSDVNELKELVEYLQDRVKKLKAAGNELIEYVRDGTSESNYRLLVDAWEKAKGKI